MLDDETLRDGLQSPSVRTPTIEQKLEDPAPHRRAGHRHGRHRPARRGPARRSGCRAAGARDRRREAARPRQLRGADRSWPTSCRSSRSRSGRASQSSAVHVHRLQPDSPVRGGLDDRSAAAADRGGRELRGAGRARRSCSSPRTRPAPIRSRCGRSTRRRSAPAPGGSASPTPSATRRRPARARSCGSCRRSIDECGGGIGIDWHGHRDRDLAVENSLAAMEAGATRLHGAAIGIGERVGNTPMDVLLVNLVLMGMRDGRPDAGCRSTAQVVSDATGVPIPRNYPVVGRDAFRTATGVHAAAVIKAFKKHDLALADAVYSGVPAQPRRPRADRSRSARCLAGRTSSTGSRSAVSSQPMRSSIASSPGRRRQRRC